MFHKIGLYFRTIKHLKPIQFRYRLGYLIRNKFRRITGHNYPLSIPKEGHTLELITWIPQPSTFNLQPLTNKKTFTFLNQSYTFNGPIDWNLTEYGKLWAYNLNYFDYLQQKTITKELGLKLIRQFICQMPDNKEGMEPYPVSLRCINWIKFLSKHEIRDAEIDSCLYAQYQILVDNLEYHILGNHLLENGCSLLFGALYFRDESLWWKAKEIIIHELDEQILKDGGHYERSVMYHCIILERLLDCYNAIEHNASFEDQDNLMTTVVETVKEMLGWLIKMQWQDGKLPPVNDHVSEMIPEVSELLKYANRLEIEYTGCKLSESGYRKYKTANYEVLVDVGNIGPDYVPGHAHSDTFSFLFNINRREVITETGTSTYENNERRQIERATAAHNTVIVDGKEQNEVWSAFRVGRRGHVKIISDQKNEIIAEHDGYQFLGVTHERRFTFGVNEFTIHDTLKKKGGNTNGTFYLHFAPGIEIRRAGNKIEGRNLKISFSGHSSIDLGLYKKAVGYHKYKNATQLSVVFQDNLITKCKILNHR